MTSYAFDNASQALPHLMRNVLIYGFPVPSRNGDCKELTHVQIKLEKPGTGYITTPERRVSVAAQIAETAWILAGRSDVEWLSRYLPRAVDFSDDGKTWRGGYGPRIRAFGDDPLGSPGVDQLQHVIELLKEDPNTRRAVINIYDPLADTEPGKDIPCNNWLHFLARDGKLTLHVATRSNDLMWGWSGINAFEWNILLQVVAGLTGLKPGGIVFSISSLHLYESHFGRAKKIVNADQALSNRQHPPAPLFTAGEVSSVSDLDALLERWFDVEKMIRDYADGVTGAKDRFRVTEAICAIEEPMLQSWLWVLLAWNKWEDTVAQKIYGTDLAVALKNSPKRKKPAPALSTTESKTPTPPDFLQYVIQLHAEKDAAYGDSWQRRGEQIGIMANIARKADRLGVAGGGDSSADTAVDMMVYLVKYVVWLDRMGANEPMTGPAHQTAVENILRRISANAVFAGATIQRSAYVEELKTRFDHLEKLVTKNAGATAKAVIVGRMAVQAYNLAGSLWMAEESWKLNNATRPFNGYADTEGETK